MKQSSGSAAAAVGLALAAGVFVARAAPPASPPLPPGTIITVAGNGRPGLSGDGGPAIQAMLDNPLSLAFDTAGNLFIGDAYNARVRKVSPDGTITTVVGSQAGGFSGDGGPAIKAELTETPGVAVDEADDLFVTDFGNQRVRKVNTAGIITTVAGGGHPPDTVGDGGLATAAALVAPGALAVDRMGDLFIADLGSQRVRKVDPAGIITTVAGGGHPADGPGDGGLATDAHLLNPAGLALDPAGNLYIADSADNRVRKVSPDGKISTVAGGGSPADGLGDGGPATKALLVGPTRIAVDPAGALFIPENRGERVRKVSPDGTIRTVAGTGQVGYKGDGGPALDARLNSPAAVCIDRAGNLFLAEGNRNLITVTNGKVSAMVIQTGNMVVREVIGAAAPQ